MYTDQFPLIIIACHNIMWFCTRVELIEEGYNDIMMYDSHGAHKNIKLKEG